MAAASRANEHNGPSRPGPSGGERVGLLDCGSVRPPRPGAAMPCNRVADQAGETFHGLLLRLRGRTPLTQRQLALQLGVGMRSVQAWEAGDSFPSAETLQTLIARYLDLDGFAVGREAAEAAALWTAAEQESTRL